jgi:uncharacterized protein YgbK (DUF1537 family)
MDFPNIQSDLRPAANSSPCTRAASAAACGRIVLLADDLTGACDASAGFVNQGFTASVLLRELLPEQAPATDLVAAVTYTRDLGPDATRQLLLNHPILRNFNSGNIFHKVDSAGRGNPGVEMTAIAAQAHCDAIVFAPAFPGAGRVVRNGQLHVVDFSRQNRHTDLLSLLPSSLRSQAELVPIQSVEFLHRKMEAANSVRRNLWICDAASEKDLDAIVEAASGLPLRILWSGSAGLAAAVARHCASSASGRTALRTPEPRPGRTLVVSGTDHAVTLAQFERLAVSVVRLSLDAAVVPDFACGCLQLDWARTTPGAVRGFWQRLHKADQPPITSLVLTGGDTAAFVLEALGASSLILGGELEQGIPWSRVVGGWADGALAITKSGGFGTVDSLTHCAQFSQRMKG